MEREGNEGLKRRRQGEGMRVSATRGGGNASTRARGEMNERTRKRRVCGIPGGEEAARVCGIRIARTASTELGNRP